MAQLVLNVLGCFEAYSAGKSTPKFETNKVRALLAYLAVEAGQAHTREALMGLLWPDSTQFAASESLRHALATLRKVIGDPLAQPPFLLITRKTLQFNRECEVQIDVWDFERILAQESTGDYTQQSISRLASAAQLYRGPFLDGFQCGSDPFEKWAQTRRESLAHRMREALLTLAVMYEETEAYKSSVQSARRALELEPWDESAHRLVMAGLAHLGDRSAALAHYRICCKILEEELNVEPSPATQRLYEAILHGDWGDGAAILSERDQKPQAAVDRQSGSQYLPPSLNTTAQVDVLAPYATPFIERPPQHNLPAGWLPLIGRERELDEITTLLSDPACRLLTLTGPGGIGKTHLALEASAQSAVQFSKGACFVPLSAIASADVIPLAIAQALNFHFYPGGESVQELLDFLRQRELLLLLDNFEHLLDGAHFVTSILQAAPQVKLIVTSRARLNLSNEHVYPLDGLDFPSPPSEDFEGFTAVKLFMQGTRRVKPGFQAAREDWTVIGEICRRVQGLPLGILLAASWMGTLSPPEILQAIDSNSLDFLAADWRDAPQRQRSLRSVFDISYQLLPLREQEIFAGLSVFQGGFTLATAQMVTGVTLHELRSLVDKSLVQSASAGRYQLHELLRRYATDALEQNPVLHERAHDRHAACFAAMLQDGWKDFQGPRQFDVLDAFRSETENILAAWHWMVDHLQIARMSQAMFLLFEALKIIYPQQTAVENNRAMLKEAIRRLEPQVTASPSNDPEKTRLAIWLKYLEYKEPLIKSDLAVSSTRQIEGWIHQLEEAGEDVRFEKALIARRYAEFSAPSGNAEAFGRFYGECLELLYELGDSWQAARVLADWSWWLIMLDDYAEGRRRFIESLELHRKLGDRSVSGSMLDTLCDASWQRLEFDENERLLCEVLGMYHETGSAYLIAFGTGQLGRFLTRQGRFEESRALLSESVATFEKLGAAYLLHSFRTLLSEAELNLGHFEHAQKRIQESLTFFRQNCIVHQIAWCLLLLGWDALTHDRYAEGEQYLKESLATWPANFRTPRMVIQALLVNVRWMHGEHAQALEELHETLRIATEKGELAVLLFAVPAAALILADRGEGERVVELQALVNRYGFVSNSRLFEGFFGRKVSALAATLPPETIHAAQARGQARDLRATAEELLEELSGFSAQE